MTYFNAISGGAEPVGLDALRAMQRLMGDRLCFTLKQRQDGFELHFQGLGKGKFIEAVLMAEKSKKPRLFVRPETAFRLLQGLGVRDVSIQLLPSPDLPSPDSGFRDSHGKKPVRLV